MTVKVGIAGVTGYTGGELIRLLMNHPEAKIVAASSRSNVGNPVSAVHKQLYGYMDLIECEMKAENFAECDVVFLALPHGASSGLAKELVSMGKKVIDLGADMRLRDYDTYMEWYGAEHHWPEILPDAVLKRWKKIFTADQIETFAILFALLCNFESPLFFAKFKVEEISKVAQHVIVSLFILRETIEYGRCSTLIFQCSQSLVFCSKAFR